MLSREQKAYVRAQLQHVATDRVGFVRWMIRLYQSGYDPQDDLMGDAMGRNN